MNKKIIAILTMFIMFFVFAQTIYAVTKEEINEQILKRLGFTNEEIKGLMKIQEDTQKVIVLAKAEMDIYRAEMKKLLLSPDVNMKDVEKILRKSMEWELKMRLAQIRREVESRKLVGDKKWARLVQYLKKIAARKAAIQNEQRSNPRNNNNIQRKKSGETRLNLTKEEKIKKLIRELEQLLEEPGN